MCVSQYKSGHAPEAAFRRLMDGAPPQVGQRVRIVTEGPEEHGHHFSANDVGLVAYGGKGGKNNGGGMFLVERTDGLKQGLDREDFELID